MTLNNSSIVIRHDNGQKFIEVSLSERGIANIAVHGSGSLTDAHSILNDYSVAIFNRTISMDELLQAIKESRQ